MTQKHTQLLRQFIWRHLWVSVVNAVNLKEIEQVVFKQWTFEVCKTFFNLYHIVKIPILMVNTHCENCCNFIGQCEKSVKIKL